MKQGTEILIVEDEPVQAMKLQFILEQAGYSVAAAHAGAEALDRMEESIPILVITDIIMPEMDGYELCRRIRTRDVFNQVPIIILTSHADPTDVLKGLAVGADSFVTKPYEADNIKTRVKHVLAGGKSMRKKEEEIAVAYRGQQYVITASRFQMLGFFLAMYETLMQKSFELMTTQEELNGLNANLEQLVEERTVALMKEVAEREKAEARVREQATLLDKAQEGIIQCNLTKAITYWNRSAQRMYGWTIDEAKGKGLTDVLFSEDEHAGESAFEHTLISGEWSGEFRQKTKDGSQIIVHSSWTLIRSDNGDAESVLMINSDITAKKRVDEQMLRNQRMESIGTLAGGISHDLNNVLSPILLSISLLKDKVTTDEGGNLLGMIETSTQRAANMVKQVLTFARGVEGERLLIHPSQVTREIVKMAGQSFPKNISLDVSVPDVLGFITGDPTQLHQVLLNLCVNARDAMPQGGTISIHGSSVTIDDQFASMTPDAKPGEYILLSIRDTGPGIPAELRDRIFDPFFTTKEIGKGTGLGLSTVLAIVRNHGGFLVLNSHPGKGAEFQIYLPASNVRGPNAPAHSTAALVDGNGELILVVDDERLVREVTRLTLEGHGYRVLTANDGAEALARCAEHRGELRMVLTDIVMPHLDGVGMVRALHSLDASVKVLATSGLAESQQRLEGVADVVIPFINKPYTTETLLAKMHEMLAVQPESVS